MEVIDKRKDREISQLKNLKIGDVFQFLNEENEEEEYEDDYIEGVCMKVDVGDDGLTYGTEFDKCHKSKKIKKSKVMKNVVIVSFETGLLYVVDGYEEVLCVDAKLVLE